MENHEPIPERQDNVIPAAGGFLQRNFIIILIHKIKLKIIKK